jgi:ATP-dependent helicase/nuclease subunit B
MTGRLHAAAYGRPATRLLLELVAAARGGDPFAEVTVAVPSAAAGTTLRRELATGSGGILNVSFVSLPQIADRLVALAPPDAGRPPPAAPLVARAHLRALLRGGGPLVPDPAVAASAATERAVGTTFAELAPLPEEALDRLAEAGPGPATLVELFREHRRRTGAPGPDEHPTAVATRLLAAGEVDPSGLGTVAVHLPRRLGVGEADLLGALARHVPVHAVVGFTGDPQVDAIATDLLAALAGPLGAEVPAGPHGIARSLPTRLVWAPDPAEEAAIAAREVVAAIRGADGRDPVRPERIAVVHRVRDPWANLLHAALAAAEVPHHARSTTTLAQSIPGRVARSVLAVAADGFRRADVAALWRSGPVLDPVSGHLVPTSWDAVARAAGVRGGVDEWHQRLALARANRLSFLGSRSEASHGEPFDPGDTPDGLDWRVARLDELDAHISWLAQHLQPPDEPTWAAWAGWLGRLLDELLGASVARREPSAEAAARVSSVVASLAHLDGVEPPPDLDRLRRVLEPELDRPDHGHGRFGHGVLVGRLVDVVGADLDVVVVVGASDGELPPHRREDPLLPDAVRERVGGLLGPRSLRRDEEHRDLLAALASAPTAVLLGHRAEPRQQHERPPAAWFTAAASDLAGRQVSGHDLASLAGEPWFHLAASFEQGVATPATPFELDLADLLADHRAGRVHQGEVASARQGLARGLAAARSRLEGRFDEFTGRVGPHPSLVRAFDRPQSATSLEAYATCPFRYLLRTVLRVGALDDPAGAEEISALDQGSLVHEVLERFIGGSLGQPPDQPWSAADHQRLQDTLTEVAARYEAEGLTGRRLLWSVRLDEIRHQLRRALEEDDELRAASGAAPTAVELMFGDDGTPPVALTTSGGRAITFKGSIDRVDRSPDGRVLAVYDYKTGRAASFDKLRDAIEAGDITAAGTKLQLPIYALAARTAYPGAQQVSAHYWFVASGEGQRGTEVTVDDDRRFQEVMDVVVEGIEDGTFPANPGAESWDRGRWVQANCKWCDYEAVCPTTRGGAWVQLRTKPELRRYVELAEGPPPAADDPGAGDG